MFSAITALEVRSALQRRCRHGDITKLQVQDALILLQDEVRRTTQMPLTQTLLQATQEVIDTFQLRAADAIQLAAALAFAETEPSLVTVFIASDLELLAAAAQAGLETLNPAYV